MTAAASSRRSVDDPSSQDHHGAISMQNVAKSVASVREATRKKISDLIWAGFGDAGHTQKAVASAAARLTRISERQIINYMQRKHDAPHYIAEILEDYVVAKTERLARRIGGEP